MYVRTYVRLSRPRETCLISIKYLTLYEKKNFFIERPKALRLYTQLYTSLDTQFYTNILLIAQDFYRKLAMFVCNIIIYKNI